MVRIKSGTSKEGIGAFLVDGYAPQPQQFEALQPWHSMKKTGVIPYKYWIERVRIHQRKIKKRYKETTYLTAYRNTILAIARSEALARIGRDDLDIFSSPLLYHGFTTGKTQGSIMSSSSCIISSPVRKDQLPLLEKEYQHDENLGRKHYIQNVFVYPTNVKGASFDIEDCCKKWIDLLEFREKNADDYIDLDGFQRAWHSILSDMTGRRKDCSFYWHLYDYLDLY